MDRKKKLKILTVFPIISELIALFFLPSEVPVHYNSAFQIDGYGSKYCVLVLGVLVIGFGLFMNLLYTKNRETKNETLIYRLCMLALLVFNVMNVLFLYECMTATASIGIIGGADGPTTIFLAGSVGSGIPLLLIIGFIIGIVVLKLKKR